MRKTILVSVTVALLAALPSYAAAPSIPSANPGPVAAVAADASLPALFGCGQALGKAPALDLRGTSVRLGEAAGPICPVAVDVVQPSSRPFHGHCKCSCSVIPDCNTSADCGGAPCLAAITCC
jgi:hypothetical protein